MHCTICNLPTGNIVGSILPQCKCGWQKPNSPVTQRTWVGLTNEDLSVCDEDGVILARYWEAKLKEKNT
jgi:hypothetical protein